MELHSFTPILLLAIAARYINLCEGQTGVCNTTVTTSIPIVVYSSESYAQWYRCSVFGPRVCTRNGYRQVSSTSFRTEYSQEFGCCDGYQQEGADCIPTCSPECVSGECTAPNNCTCDAGWTGDSCQIDINECLSTSDVCAQNCVNTNGSFVCSCDVGYGLADNGTDCYDINECLTGNGGCEQGCANSVGSFQCFCNEHYNLAPNGFNCDDIDECQINNGNCEQVCTNKNGSFTCSCSEGYRLADDGFSCTDIDECTSGISGCQQVCVNTLGSYECSCFAGYGLESNGTSCIDTDECQTDNGGCEQICINTMSSFECSCSPGFVLSDDNQTCTDIDECSVNMGGCDHSCNNTPGSFTCYCQTGYELASDGSGCNDIDECANDGGGCEYNCINLVGSYVCSCPAKYTLDNDRLSCSVAVPSLAPTVTALQRTSATSARIEWDPIPYQNRNGDLVSYHLNYTIALNGTCATSSSGEPMTTLASPSDSVGFLTDLAPLQEYCLQVAGATAHGVGVFTRYWKIPLYTNNLFQIQLSGVGDCSKWRLRDTNEKLEYFSSTITTLMESLCGCATAGYIGDFLTVCTDTSPDEIVIQGRAVGTPTVSSAQMVDQLQNFVLDQPAPIVYQGQTLAIVQTCSVTQVTQLGESTCPSAMETETMYTETLATATYTKDSTVAALIGGVSGGVLLLVVIALVALVTTFVVLRKVRGEKFYNEENTKAPLEMKSNIADSYHHGAGKESSYETLIENPYYREHTGNQPDDNVIITSLRKIPE